MKRIDKKLNMFGSFLETRNFWKKKVSWLCIYMRESGWKCSELFVYMNKIYHNLVYSDGDSYRFDSIIKILKDIYLHIVLVYTHHYLVSRTFMIHFITSLTCIKIIHVGHTWHLNQCMSAPLLAITLYCYHSRQWK